MRKAQAFACGAGLALDFACTCRALVWVPDFRVPAGLVLLAFTDT